jgi:hypothetical protein
LAECAVWDASKTDILGALDKIKATVSVEDAARFREWTDRFGSNGS